VPSLPNRPPVTGRCETPEQRLLERVRAGDQEAFSAVFTAHYADLHRFTVYLVRATEVAEELVQEVFLWVWQQRSTWRPEGGVRAYLFTACRNRALDYLKHLRRADRIVGQIKREGLAAGLGRMERTPDTAAEADELAAAMRQAVAELPERRRLVVVLRWQHQMSHAEIGQVMGISEKGVETQFARAMIALRHTLAKYRL